MSTKKAVYIRWIENHPLGALVIILFSVTTAVISAASDLLDLQAKSHHFYGAPELADQYYASIPAESLEEAESIRNQLIDLSILSTSYQLANQIIEEEQETYGFLSSNVLIGFGPDQVVYARHPQYDGRWLIGIDLVQKQSSFDTIQIEIEKIRRAIDRIEKEFPQPSHPLRKSLEPVKELLQQMIPSYFSVLDYESTYGVRPSKE